LGGPTGLTLGQVAVAAKANASTAMPHLLALLDLRQQSVTTAALACQKEIAQTLVEQKGAYLLAAKDHQPTLPAGLPAAFASAETQAATRPRA